MSTHITIVPCVKLSLSGQNNKAIPSQIPMSKIFPLLSLPVDIYHEGVTENSHKLSNHPADYKHISYKSTYMRCRKQNLNTADGSLCIVIPHVIPL